MKLIHLNNNKIMKKFKFFELLMVMVLCAIGFAACSGDDDNSPSISTSPITVYVNEPANVDGATNLVSKNKFVATAKGDTVKGFHVGETTVTEGSTTIPVTVRGRYHTYNDPVTDWGCSKSTVKSRQTQGTLSVEKTITGSNLIDYAIGYKNAGSATVLMYAFKNDKLVCVLAYVDYTYMDSFVKYLAERYLFLPEEVASYTYAGINGLTKETCTTIVTMGIQNSLNLAATYMPMSIISSSAKANTRSRVVRNDFGSKTEAYKKVLSPFVEDVR
jgi:hypothetical protein